MDTIRCYWSGGIVLSAILSAMALATTTNVWAQEPSGGSPESSSAPTPMAADPEEAPTPAEEPGGVGVFLFADAYYSYNTQAVGTEAPGHGAFDRDNGFRLSWLGMDVTYDGGPIGATASFRLGPSNPIFFGGDTSPEFYPLIQAYATWSPVEALTLDLGQFYTIYGAEVAESWENLNYSRGALYYAMQPFWHTGLRANYAFSDSFGLNALVVNGVNQSFALNHAPALGLQAVLTPGEVFSLSVGYLHQTDPDSAVFVPGGNPVEDRSPFNNFVDVVATLSLGKLSLIGNFDYNVMQAVDSAGSAMSFWGASLAAGYAFSDMFAAAIRGEFLKDPDGLVWGNAGGNLVTGTLTLEVKPLGDNLVVRWDNRVEHANNDIFFDRNASATGTWLNSVLGVVVKSN